MYEGKYIPEIANEAEEDEDLKGKLQLLAREPSIVRAVCVRAFEQYEPPIFDPHSSHIVLVDMVFRLDDVR